MPMPLKIVAAASALMLARAPAPSVTLTASATPTSRSALRCRSPASQEAGGAISAVMAKRPARSRSSNVLGPGELSFMANLGGQDAALARGLGACLVGGSAALIWFKPDPQ